MFCTTCRSMFLLKLTYRKHSQRFLLQYLVKNTKFETNCWFDIFNDCKNCDVLLRCTDSTSCSKQVALIFALRAIKYNCQVIFVTIYISFINCEIFCFNHVLFLFIYRNVIQIFCCRRRIYLLLGELSKKIETIQCSLQTVDSHACA